MPIEIRELVIRATVTSESEKPPSVPQAMSAETEQAIIDACVKQVLKILASKKER